MKITTSSSVVKDMKDAYMHTRTHIYLHTHIYTYACMYDGEAHRIININNIARIFVATFNAKRQLATTVATAAAHRGWCLNTLRAMCRQQHPGKFLVVFYGECSFFYFGVLHRANRWFFCFLFLFLFLFLVFLSSYFALISRTLSAVSARAC